MPTLVTTVGSASANSYISEADATSYFSKRLNVSAWTDTVAEDHERALLMAAQKLQTESWLGTRVDSTQALAWPRSSVLKPDGVGTGSDFIPGAGALTSYRGGYGLYFSSFGDTYDTDEIPQEVKDAQCEIAISLLSQLSQLSQSPQPGAENRRVKSWSADGVSASFEYSGTINSLPVRVLDLISRLITGAQIRRG